MKDDWDDLNDEDLGDDEEEIETPYIGDYLYRDGIRIDDDGNEIDDDDDPDEPTDPKGWDDGDDL